MAASHCFRFIEQKRGGPLIHRKENWHALHTMRTWRRYVTSTIEQLASGGTGALEAMQTYANYSVFLCLSWPPMISFPLYPNLVGPRGLWLLSIDAAAAACSGVIIVLHD